MSTQAEHTPRCDAKQDEINESGNLGNSDDICTAMDFARELEIENARLRASNEDLVSVLRREIENFDCAIHGRPLPHPEIALNNEARAALARAQGGAK